LLLEPVAKRMRTAGKASRFQFAPELRSVVASVLPALFKILPVRFNGRMAKTALAFRKLLGSEPASHGLSAQTTLARDLSL
jgi:hypothetical protein